MGNIAHETIDCKSVYLLLPSAALTPATG